MHFKKKLFLILFINWILALTGDELIIQMDNKPSPDNFKANMNMTLTNKKNKARISKIHTIIKNNGRFIIKKN